jgi:hypothetical protein
VAKAPLQPTDEQKRAAFQNSMWYEIVYTFGIPRHDPFDYCHWETVNFTRLAHARVLYAFLETSKERRFMDDVLAEDYGYNAKSVTLPDEDRLRLNKDLFHFSYQRLRHTRESKCWPDSILSNLLEPVLGFMRYIRDNRPDLFYTPEESKGWSELIGMLESGRELHISSWAEPDGMTRYQLALGPPLPDGKPILTRQYALERSTFRNDAY